MLQAGDDRELITMLLEDFEIWGWGVLFAGLFGEEVVGMKSEGRTDADHSTRKERILVFSLQFRSKGVEPGKGKRDAGGADKVAAFNFHRIVILFRLKH